MIILSSLTSVFSSVLAVSRIIWVISSNVMMERPPTLHMLLNFLISPNFYHRLTFWLTPCMPVVLWWPLTVSHIQMFSFFIVPSHKLLRSPSAKMLRSVSLCVFWTRSESCSAGMWLLKVRCKIIRWASLWLNCFLFNRCIDFACENVIF